MVSVVEVTFYLAQCALRMKLMPMMALVQIEMMIMMVLVTMMMMIDGVGDDDDDCMPCAGIFSRRQVKTTMVGQ